MKQLGRCSALIYETRGQTSCSGEVSFRQASPVCHQQLRAYGLSSWASLLPFCYELNTGAAEKTPRLYDGRVKKGLYDVYMRT